MSAPPGGSSLMKPSPSLSTPSGKSRKAPDSPFFGSALFIRRGSSGSIMYSPPGALTRMTVMKPSPLRSSGPSSSTRPSLSSSRRGALAADEMGAFEPGGNEQGRALPRRDAARGGDLDGPDVAAAPRLPDR